MTLYAEGVLLSFVMTLFDFKESLGQRQGLEMDDICVEDLLAKKYSGVSLRCSRQCETKVK
jgi:hypothetical protein